MASNGPQSGPLVLGLTGPIACGKTTVGDILLELGAIERIDADRVVHSLFEAGSPVATTVGERFGPQVLNPDGSIDRNALGAVVFSNADALRDLEAITHPAVRAVIRDRLESLAGTNGVVVVDAVKLLQSELLQLCDAIWVIRCDTAQQIRRLGEIRGLSADAIRGRRASQPSFEHPAVTTVIENSGSVDDLRRAVSEAWKELLADAGK